MVQQDCIHGIQARRTFGATVHRAWCVFITLCLACLAPGCADETLIHSLKAQIAERADAIRAEERMIEEQRATVAALTRKVESIEAERAAKREQLVRVKKESPTISTCVLGQGEAKGVLVAVFGESEADRYAGGFVAAVCFLARFHDDYNAVSRQVDAILPALADVSQRLAEPMAQLRRAEASLNQIVIAPSAPRLQQEIDALNVALACERVLSCRAKRVVAGNSN